LILQTAVWNLISKKYTSSVIPKRSETLSGDPAVPFEAAWEVFFINLQ
jgi:hypothetical protein